MAGFFGTYPAREPASVPDRCYFIDVSPGSGVSVERQGLFFAAHYRPKAGARKSGASIDGTVVAGYAGYIENLEALWLERLAARVPYDPATVLADLFAILDDRLWVHLNGNFAAYAVDLQKGRLILATDRLGTLPLYYHLEDGGISFSTSMLALGSTLAWKGLLDMRACVEYLSFGYPLDDRTLVSGIRALKEASILVLSGRTLSFGTYWRPPVALDGQGTAEGLVEEYQVLLDDAVCRFCRGARPGLALSAGLDSRQIAARAGRRAHLAVVNGSAGQAEARGARGVSEVLDLSLTCLTYDGERFAETCKDAIIATDGVIDTPEFLLMARLLAEECDVEMLGAYGDVLRGRTGRYAWRYKSLDQAKKDLCALENWDFVRFGEASRVYGPLVGPELVRLARESYLSSFDCGDGHSPFHAVLLQNTGQTHRRRVFPILGAGRRALEVRFPLTDNGLVEFVFALPWRMKAHDDIYRQCFVRAYPGLASIPNSVGASFLYEEKYGWLRDFAKRGYYCAPGLVHRALAPLLSSNGASTNSTVYGTYLREETASLLDALARKGILKAPFVRGLVAEPRRLSERYVLVHRLFTLGCLVEGFGPWKGLAVARCN